MLRPRTSALAVSATFLATAVTAFPAVPAHAHTDHTWFGVVTAEQHQSSTDPDGATHSVDMSLRFASATDLGDASATTMTYSYHYRDSYPATVPGASCSITYDYVGSGTVPASADFILAEVPDQYRVVTTPGAPTEYDLTITLAGPSNCADVITSTGGTFLGTQSITYESPTPIGPDPLHLDGRVIVPIQQGITGDSTWAWNVDDTNHPPDGVDDTATTDACVGIDIDVLFNDTDPDGDTLDLVSVNDPLGGTALIERGTAVTIRYTPELGFTGEDVFGYQLTDSHGATATASVRVTVNPDTSCPTDTDGDGNPDSTDPCPFDPLDQCVLPPDGDGDGVADSVDNCPSVYNPDQADADADGVGDACENTPPLDCDSPDVSRGTFTDTWSARVVVAFAPDATLFHFQPSIRYCYDGNTARVTGGDAFGYAETGVYQGVLALLGFEPNWVLGSGHLTPNANTANAVGEFTLDMDTRILASRIGINKVVDKVVGGALEKAITKALKKFGNGPAFQAALVKELDDIYTSVRAKADEIDVTLKKKKIPAPVAEWLEDQAEAWVDGFLSSWYNAAKAYINADGVGKTPSEIAAHISQDLVDAINEALIVHLEFWTPEVAFSVNGRGEVERTLVSPTHPLLTVEESTP